MVRDAIAKPRCNTKRNVLNSKECKKSEYKVELDPLVRVNFSYIENYGIDDFFFKKIHRELPKFQNLRIQF
jgi:hypothetical protein